MKTLLVSLCACIAINLNAQQKISPTSSDKNGLFEWNNTVLMKECDQDGSPSGTSTTLSLAKQKFYVITSNDSVAVIKILDYTEERDEKDSIYSTLHEKSGKHLVEDNFFLYNFSGEPSDYANLSESKRNGRDYGDFQKFFLVTAKDIELHAKDLSKVGVAFAFGIVNLPFKYRPQPDRPDFSGSLNVSNALGVTWKKQIWRKASATTVLSYGISNTLLDSVSVTSNHQKLDQTNTFPTLTLAFGQLFTYQNVQIGLFVGMDRLSRQNQTTFGWKYQGNPWFSIAFGYSIFSTESKKVGGTGAEQ